MMSALERMGLRGANGPVIERAVDVAEELGLASRGRPRELREKLVAAKTREVICVSLAQALADSGLHRTLRDVCLACDAEPGRILALEKRLMRGGRQVCLSRPCEMIEPMASVSGGLGYSVVQRARRLCQTIESLYYGHSPEKVALACIRLAAGGAGRFGGDGTEEEDREEGGDSPTPPPPPPPPQQVLPAGWWKELCSQHGCSLSSANRLARQISARLRRRPPPRQERGCGGARPIMLR